MFKYISSTVKIGYVICACLSIFVAGQVQATTLPFGLNEASQAVFGDAKGLTGMKHLNLGEADPLTMAYSILNIVLTFLAFGFLILLVYAGVLWVWARGEEAKITKAKDLIRQSIIGLIIVLAALGVSMFLFKFVNILWHGDLW